MTLFTTFVCLFLLPIAKGCIPMQPNEELPTTTSTSSTSTTPSTTTSTTSTSTTTTTTTVNCITAVWTEWVSIPTPNPCDYPMCGYCGHIDQIRTCPGTCTCPGASTKKLVVTMQSCGYDDLCVFPLRTCCPPYMKTIIVMPTFACR